MGKFLANDGINKYYKSLIRMFDTKFMLTKSPHIWGLIHSHGTVSMEPITDTGATSTSWTTPRRARSSAT